MTDPRQKPASPLTRRAVLYGGALVPLAFLVGASPARAASMGESITATKYQDYPAVMITSTTGAPLAAGTYRFDFTGGVEPAPAVFFVSPAVSAYAAYGGNRGSWSAWDRRRYSSSGERTVATVTLPPGHSVTEFGVVIALTEPPAGVDALASMLTSTPSGSMHTLPLFGVAADDTDAEPSTSTEVDGVFGPSGEHWPTRTPRPDDDFDWVVDVDPSWTALASAIADATTHHPTGKVKIRVRPGLLPGGFGAGSSSRGILSGLGAADRPWRILVVPRDGWGTVTPVSTYASGTSKGYSLVDVAGVSMMGFDFLDHTVLIRNCHDLALGWSTVGRLNITANGSDVTGIELVECVLPQSGSGDTDSMGFRLANGYSIDGLVLDGCYVAPSYKLLASSGHTDTLQTSRTGSGTHRNLTLRDSVFFQSSSQAVLLADADQVDIDHVAVIGGLRGVDRHPISSDQYTMTAENALWGSPTNVRVTRSLILGSIHQDCSFASVSDSVASKEPSAAIADGAFSVDERFADRSTPMGGDWYAAHCPLPDASRLGAVWSALV